MNEIFDLVMRIGEKEQVLPIVDKVWSHKVDDLWSFEVNGKLETINGIPPFNIKVEYNGWPAGLIGYDGGVIAAGAAANEDSFISALKEHLQENVA